MQMDDPPYLSVGTAVSAKYKGAFCEAKVSKVDRVVKCRVTFKTGLGTAVVSDNDIKGTLRVGQQVQVKHPDQGDLMEATISKIQDCSQYTVVFDDGDITTLRRTALCLKSGRHFNESETLDQLPLTHPEHFGIPVMGGRRGRRNRLLKDESSDEEIEEENMPDLEGYAQDIGRVVSVETGENKRGKEKWFPGLIVIPSAQPTVKINVKDEFLIRSFRDDRYYTVPKKEVNEFGREPTERIESAGLAEAIQKANKFLDTNELPLHWEKSSLFNLAGDSDSEDNASDTSDEEQSEEKDRFVAQLYKYMDDSGTPLNKTPTISSKDIDLHKLFRLVDKMGGYNRVTNQNKWKSVAGKLKLAANQNVSNQVKSVYKKCLLSYEGFFRTLGVTMSMPVKATKKDKGRSLIRDKDRTPISSPRPDDDGALEERKTTPIPEKIDVKPKKKPEPKEKEPKKPSDVSDTPSTSRPKRSDPKLVKDKKPKTPQGDKVKVLVEKYEEPLKKEEKVQFTRSKSQSSGVKPKETPPKDMVTTRQSKEASSPVKLAPKPLKKLPSKEEEEKNKNPKPKKKEMDKEVEPVQTASLGDKLIVYYGPTNESKVTYEAKVVDQDRDQTGPIYLVHYTGWNTRYDEWIPASRIAENLTTNTKSKRSSKVPAPVNVRPSTGGPSSSGGSSKPAKRNRLASVSSREDKPPRSTTPSSVTSSSSHSKSPAAPTTRSIRLAAKQESKRRVSAMTDASALSESDSESSISEADLSRTRSGSIKSEEMDVKVYRKRVSRLVSPPKSHKRKEPTKDDDDTEKEEDPSDKGPKDRKMKKPKKSADDSDDEDDVLGHARGRDFDLNQIRSELKGFSKALKVPTDGPPSSDDSSEKPPEVKEEKEVEVEEPKPPLSPKLEKSSSSEDIYEFKEPEPFEFESRSKLGDDKASKKRLPRIFDSFVEDKTRRPTKSDALGRPEPRTYSRFPKKIHVSEDEEEEEEEEDLMEEEPRGKNEDPFDKLIESPSFNVVKTDPEKPVESKPVFDSSSLFKEPPETSDEYSRDMELSDCESQTQIFTREDTLFPNPLDRNTPDFASTKIDESKTTNSEDDEIQAQIQRAIAQSSSTDEDNDDDSNPLGGEAEKTKQGDVASAPPIIEKEAVVPLVPVTKEEEAKEEPKKPIDPALQESDSTLLESIVSTPPLILNPKLDDTGKELTVKTGTKIADSILQKFNSIKNSSETTRHKQQEPAEVPNEPPQAEIVPEPARPSEAKLQADEEAPKVQVPDPEPSTSKVEGSESRRRRRAISKPIIDESDSDTSDSEHLVIGSEEDEDSQTNSSDNKPLIENKNTDSNLSLPKALTTTDDSQSQPEEEEKRNFSFEDVLEQTPDVPEKEEAEAKGPEKEEAREDQGPNLHSLLLCEEEIPRSPAPASEVPPAIEGASTSSIHEMPFASAPGSSNTKMLLEPKKPQPPPLLIPLEREGRADAQTVIENTPPTTPESTISNLSPRGENGNISPNSNDSKSNEPDYLEPRRGPKVSPYSEEDTQPGGELPRKPSEPFGGPPMGYRKRRRSLRNSEEGSSGAPPPKRGRKPRQRRDSDSDASESSVAGSGGNNTPGSTASLYDRSARSPRPSKYNFFVEFDPSLDSAQRIAVLQQKLSELRKTYADVKAELAAVERRRKKIRRREREVAATKDNADDQPKTGQESAQTSGKALPEGVTRSAC